MIGGFLTLRQIYALIEAACEAAGGRKAWGDAHGISTSHICDVLHTRRDPGRKILRALGLQRSALYVRVSIPNR